MPQKIKQKSGKIKVSFHAAIDEETYNRIEAAAKRNNRSMGDIVDEMVDSYITPSGVRKR